MINYQPPADGVMKVDESCPIKAYHSCLMAIYMCKNAANYMNNIRTLFEQYFHIENIFAL